MAEHIKVLVSEEEVDKRIRELGEQISKDYAGKEVHLICVLKGGVFFMCELAKRITVPVSMEVCVIKPASVDDSREICETLLSGRTVILNLEGLDLEIAQRIIDFISGSAFAISGNLQKISNYIFLVTPTNVDISGDLQDLLGTSFDSSSMGSRF